MEAISPDDLCYSGGLLSVLTAENPGFEFTKHFQDAKYVMSNDNASFKYMICSANKKIYCILDFSKLRGEFLSVKPPGEITCRDPPACHGPRAVSGQVIQLAELFPYDSAINAAEMCHAKEIIICGESYSGTIGHAVAVILSRQILARGVGTITAKCVSFSGIFCTSLELKKSLIDSREWFNHVDVNVDSGILDRLLFDFQRLSVLTTSSNIEAWRVAYERIYVYTSDYLCNGRLLVDASILAALEDAEAVLDTFGHDAHGDFVTGGTLLHCTSDALSQSTLLTDEEEIRRYLTGCRTVSDIYSWRQVYSLESISLDAKGCGVCDIHLYSFALPQIAHVSIHKFVGGSLTVRVEGANLDSILQRSISQPKSYVKSEMHDFPFLVHPPEAFEISSDCRLLAVKASYSDVLITISGFTLIASALISVNSDFGSSKPFPVDIRKIVEEKEMRSDHTGPSVHPTMNAEFLGCAFLRVALCAAHCGGLENMKEEYPSVFTVWERLIDIEVMCEFSCWQLERQLELYISKQISISQLQSNCMKHLIEISEHTTERFQLEENIIKRGARKTLGGVSKVSGTILGIAGAIVSLPAVLLSIPGLIIANRRRSIDEPPGLTYSIGTGLYVGVIGIVGLPSLIISSLATGLRMAGDFAMKDSQTYEYKKIVSMLISLLGMEHSEILDEVAPLEDYFVTTFNTRFPGCDLSECSHEELILTIRKAVSLGSISAANFVEAVKRVPVILKKMRLVGRIRSIRRLLCSNIMVAFLGPRGSGASTTVQRLFDVKVPALEIVPFEPLSGLSLFQQVPHPYILGQWMEKAVEESKEFADWIGKHNRAGLQVYAVDFPGVHSDIPIIDDSSLLFADVATMFVLFFTAGSLPTQEEKKIVDIAKSQRKPFLVLVNKCDLIEDVLTSSASYDTMLEKYAAALDVPSDLIHFVSSFDSYSNDKLRGIIFGLLQSIVGDTNLQDVLALRFVPGHVVDELKSDSTFNILDSAGILSKASASLMFNLCPFTYGTVGDMFTMMMSDDQRAFSCLSSESSTAVLSKNILKLSFSAIDKIRQLAISLQISDAAYNVFFESFTQRVNFAKVQLVKTVVINFESLPLDLQLKMDNAVSVIALAAMRDQLSSYFTKTSFASRDDTEAVSREVLLGIHSMTELWLERGYEQSIVSRVLKNVLTSSEPITDSAVLTLLLQEQPRHEELHSKSGFEHKEDLESYGNLEFNKFVAAKDRLKQLSKVLLFQPLPEFFAVETTRSNDSSKEDLIDGFRKKLKSLLSTHNKEVLVTLTSSENMLIEVLNNLMLMSQDQIKCSNLRFQILSESAVDASGVTRAVLAKVAQEINSRPELVYLKRDEDSKLIYFDPNACCYNIRLTDAFAETSIDVIYRGLGRLIGLCMLKSNVGATLPINFPITFYKFLLGYRIGFEDMNAISPQIANSIRSISILDSDSLKVMELTFVASTGVDQRDFELVPHGSSKTVTDHNIMTYVTEMVKFYLGCKDRDFQSDLEAPRTPLRQFILGVQDFCPRDFFHFLSPITLQTLIEGRREIDVKHWKKYTDISGSANDGSYVVQFWEVVSELSDDDKEKLLCFSIGTTSLPSKGFVELNPKFHIVFGAPDEKALPTSHTCFHMLMLPKYSSKELLRQKLLTAVRETDTAHLGIV